MNILLSSPHQYKKFCGKANFFNSDDFTESYFSNKEQDFRTVCFVNVAKAEQLEGAPLHGCEFTEIVDKKNKKADERGFCKITKRFLDDKLNYIQKFVQRDDAYLAAVDRANFWPRIQNTTKLVSLELYTKTLDELSYPEQNRLGCIMEAMITQLVFEDQPAVVQEKDPKNVKAPPRAASGKKPAEGVKGKQSKEVVEDLTIPVNKCSLFQVTNKELNVMQNLMTYDAPKLIDVDVLHIGAKYGF